MEGIFVKIIMRIAMYIMIGYQSIARHKLQTPHFLICKGLGGGAGMIFFSVVPLFNGLITYS